MVLLSGVHEETNYNFNQVETIHVSTLKKMAHCAYKEQFVPGYSGSPIFDRKGQLIGLLSSHIQGNGISQYVNSRHINEVIGGLED